VGDFFARCFAIVIVVLIVIIHAAGLQSTPNYASLSVNGRGSTIAQRCCAPAIGDWVLRSGDCVDK
jgi:hypothetical protein